MWMWNAGLNGSYVFDEKEYDAENNVTWFKKTITVAGSNVGKTGQDRSTSKRRSALSGNAIR